MGVKLIAKFPSEAELNRNVVSLEDGDYVPYGAALAIVRGYERIFFWLRLAHVLSWLVMLGIFWLVIRLL